MACHAPGNARLWTSVRAEASEGVSNSWGSGTVPSTLSVPMRRTARCFSLPGRKGFLGRRVADTCVAGTYRERPAAATGRRVLRIGACLSPAASDAHRSRRLIKRSNIRTVEAVVVGGGLAGLTFALDVADKLTSGKVLLVTKEKLKESNTVYAQGGISAVWDSLDSIESHMEDTMVAGAYMCNKDAVAVLCEEGPRRVRDLIGHGVKFDKERNAGDGDIEYHLAKEGGHSAPRILHRKDTTGVEIINKLTRKALNHGRIEPIAKASQLAWVSTFWTTMERWDDLHPGVMLALVSDVVCRLALGGADPGPVLLLSDRRLWTTVSRHNEPHCGDG
eukprot:scaffold1863_cov381-Prasinococcus_capsulatus_cf.AAC.1